MYYKNRKEDKNYKSDKYTREEADNPYVEKPRVERPRERTVNIAKWSGLYKPDWLRGFKEIKTRKYQSGESFTSADILLNSTQKNTKAFGGSLVHKKK